MSTRRSIWDRTALLFILLCGLFLLIQVVPVMILQDSALDIHIHDSYFVLPFGLYGGPMLFSALFAGFYMAYAKFSGRQLGGRLGLFHWIGTTIGLLGIYVLPLLFLYMLVPDSGIRYVSFAEQPMPAMSTIDLDLITSAFLLIAVAAQFFLVLNIARSRTQRPAL